MLTKILNGVITILAGIVGVLPIPDTFVNGLDAFFAFIIELLTAASWIIPMDILVLCFGIIWVVDHYKMIFRFIIFLIERIPIIG